MENDANCFALSEATDGAGVGHGVVFGVDPRHRLRRRRGGERQGAARTQPRHRRVGPQSAALAAARRGAWPALLVRSPGLPRDLGRRPGAGARLRRRGRARRIAHPDPRRRWRGAGAGCARTPCRPAGARAGACDQPARSGRDRAGRRTVQYGPPLHGTAAAGDTLRVQRLRAHADRAQQAWQFHPACVARHGCGLPDEAVPASAAISARRNPGSDRRAASAVWRCSDRPGQRMARAQRAPSPGPLPRGEGK